MFYGFCLFMLFSSTNGFAFNVPSYVKFNTSYYNTSDCNDILVHSITFDNVCFDGVDNCCHTALEKFSYLPNSQFGKCYIETINNDTYSYSYSCGKTGLDDRHALVVDFAIVGVISLIFLLLLLMTVFLKACCTYEYRSPYREIN